MKTGWKKHVAIFLSSQAISIFGSSLVQYAITWYITLKTQSGVMMTISILCGFVPIFVLAPFAGVLADRYNRKTLIMLSDSGIAAATLIMAILFFMGIDDIWLLFVLSAVRAVGTGIQTPAIGAFLPQLIPQEKLTRVNAINSSLQSAILLISPMVSGALLSLSPIGNIFFIDVFTAAIAVLALLFFLKVPPHEKALAPQSTGYFADLKLGLRYLKTHAYIRRFFVYYAVYYFLVSPCAFLTPLQVVRTFGSDVWRLTAIEVAFSAGMIAGGLLMASWGGFKNKVYTMALSGAVIGASTLALGIGIPFWFYLALMVIIGLVLPLFHTPSTVLLQERVEEDFLGRVFGIQAMIATSTMPLGMLVFGPISDAVRIEWILIATGIVMLAECFLLRFDRPLLAAGRSEG